MRGRGAGLGYSEDLTRRHLRPCPRGHPAQKTASPSEPAFRVRAQPRRGPHLSLPAPQPERPAPPLRAEGRRGVAEQETGKGAPLPAPLALGTKWDTSVQARVRGGDGGPRAWRGEEGDRCEGGGGGGVGVGGFGRRRDQGGNRGRLYCCPLAPPSVFLEVLAAVSRFQSQKQRLSREMLTLTLLPSAASGSPTASRPLGPLTSGPSVCAKPASVR